MLARASFEREASRFLPLFGVFCLLHLPYLANFVLSVDDEMAALRENAAVWISQGRWTTYLIEQLWLPQPSVAFFPGAIFGVCVVIAYLLLLDAHEARLKPLHVYLLFPVFAAFPTWFFIMEFYANLPAVGLGLALASLSALCFSRLTDPQIDGGDRRNTAALTAASVLSLAVAIGTYQSFILFAGSVFAGVMLFRHIRTQPKIAHMMRTTVVAAAILITAVLVYYGLWQFLLWLTGTSVEYVEGFFDIGTLFKRLGPILEQSAKEALRLYGGSAKVYGQSARIFAVLVLGALAALILVSLRTGLASLVLRTSLFGIVLVFPFVMHLTAGGFMPYRSMVAIPYVMLLCTLVLACTLRLQIVPIMVAIVVVTESIYSTSLFHTSNDLVFDHDRALAGRIYDRIVEIHPDFDRTKQYKVNLVGALPFETVYPRISSSVVGASFFEWDGGNPYRILSFMKLLGYSNLTPIGPTEAAEQALDFVTMPLWPAKDSVKLVGDTTLIRLGQSPGSAHNLMAEALAQQPFLPSSNRVVYRLDADSFANGDRVHNAVALPGPEGLRLRAGPDPQLQIALSAQAAQCRTLQVTMQQTLEVADTPRVFFLRSRETSFGPNGVGARQAAGTESTSFFFRSETGFMPLIRIDPGELPQTYFIRHIAVGCID